MGLIKHLRTRKLVAALACRNRGARLYGKPLQNLDVQEGIRIIDNLVLCLKSIPVIDEIVLGISEGDDNLIFKTVAAKHHISFIVGDEIDVLSRLIQCAKSVSATDVFRVTTESPFLCFDHVDVAWREHLRDNRDATFFWDTVDGTGFEILSAEALEISHREGLARHRSELCSLFIRENLHRFVTFRVETPDVLRRSDLRLTVDYPEDLVVCRAVFDAFRQQVPRINVVEIIAFLDRREDLKHLVSSFCQDRSKVFVAAINDGVVK